MMTRRANDLDDLIEEYEEGRAILREMKKTLGNSEIDELDRLQIDGMLREMAHNIEWMKTGHEPEESAERIARLPNMDLLPDIMSQLIEGERKSLKLDATERAIISKVFLVLSERERSCFIFYAGQNMSMAAIANKFGVSKSTVQIYLKRAKEKIDEVVKGMMKNN